MPTFIPYLLLASVLLFFYYAEQGKVKQISKQSARWSAYIILWIFIGFRGHIMSDFISYYPFFNEYPDLFHLPFDFFESRFEPGFLIYTAIFKVFCTDYFLWVAFNSFIDLIVLAWFFHRYCKSMILPLIFFMAFNGILMEFNLYRNMKAIDCFLLSIPFLQHKRFLPYFLLNLLGFSFHSSAILYIPLYFVLNRQISLLVVWGGFIISNIVFLGNVKVINNIFNNLSFIQALGLYDQVMNYGNDIQEARFSIGYFERTISFLLFSYLYSISKNRNHTIVIFYNSYWLYYCCFLSFYEVQVLVERIPYLFMYSYWVMYTGLFMVANRWNRLIKTGILFLVLFKIITSFSNPASRYENIIFAESSYEKRKQLYESAQ